MISPEPVKTWDGEEESEEQQDIPSRTLFVPEASTESVEDQSASKAISQKGAHPFQNRTRLGKQLTPIRVKDHPIVVKGAHKLNRSSSRGRTSGAKELTNSNPSGEGQHHIRHRPFRGKAGANRRNRKSGHHSRRKPGIRFKKGQH